MSHNNNTQYLEGMNEDFHIALQDRKYEECEQMIEKMKVDGFTDEAYQLEGIMEEEIELLKAQEKGSEDGMDAKQDN